MNIRNLSGNEVDAARAFLCSVGWAHRFRDPVLFRRLIRNSQRVAVAVDGEAIVGFARGLTDEVSNGYLSMVAVAPEYRRQGIGRGLVQQVVGSDRHITWVLRADRPDADEFFSALGFQRSAAAMEMQRAGQGE